MRACEAFRHTRSGAPKCFTSSEHESPSKGSALDPIDSSQPDGLPAAPERRAGPAGTQTGLSCCSSVGTSSLTVGWMCTAREMTVYG
jgi:hypothetical protein